LASPQDVRRKRPKAKGKKADITVEKLGQCLARGEPLLGGEALDLLSELSGELVAVLGDQGPGEVRGGAGGR
jgi:hypothetical protein